MPRRNLLFTVASLCAALLCVPLLRLQADPQPAAPAARSPSAVANGAPAEPLARAPAAEEAGIAVYFSPGGGCTEAIVREVDAAAQRVWVQAYSFTSAPIARALRDAHRRGVEVKVVLDDSQQTAQYSSATFFFNSGVPTFIDARHAIAHNKVILIDGRTIITGSFNFSRAAEESNAENLLIIHDHLELVRAYERNFQEHLEHSTAYTGPSDTSSPARPPPATPAAPPAGAPSAAIDASNRVATEAAVIVHVTRTGRRYHIAGCRSLSRSDTSLSLADAVGRGYTPCGVCRPPE